MRSVVGGVYGKQAAAQRCRNHKLRNVLDHLPEKRRTHARLMPKAAFNLENASKGLEELRQYAADLERGGWSSAASALRGRLDDLSTVQALGPPRELRRCLGRTNLLDAAQSGPRGLLRRVGRWRDGAMPQRWVAAALVETEKHFRKVHGYQQLWMLEANLKNWHDRSEAQRLAATDAAAQSQNGSGTACTFSCGWDTICCTICGTADRGAVRRR